MDTPMRGIPLESGNKDIDLCDKQNIACGEAWDLLTKGGVDLSQVRHNPARKQVQQIVELGATREDIEKATSRAREYKGGDKYCVAYVFPIVRQMIDERTGVNHGTSRQLRSKAGAGLIAGLGSDTLEATEEDDATE